MEKMSKYDEFIQPFLDGELSREELDWFSKELESNAVLAEDIRLYREVDSAIREHDVMELRDQLDVIHNSIGDPSVAPAKQSGYRRVLSYGAIASLAILLSLGILLKVQHNKLPNDQIYQKHQGSFVLEYSNLRSAGLDNLEELEVFELFDKAVLASEAGEFLVAIDNLKELLERYPNEKEYQFKLGTQYMGADLFPDAEKQFQDIVNHNDNNFIEQANWHLGLCYVKTGQNEVAREHFNEIAKSGSYYSKEARQIRRRIK